MFVMKTVLYKCNYDFDKQNTFNNGFGVLPNELNFGGNRCIQKLYILFKNYKATTYQRNPEANTSIKCRFHSSHTLDFCSGRGGFHWHGGRRRCSTQSTVLPAVGLDEGGR